MAVHGICGWKVYASDDFTVGFYDLITVRILVYKGVRTEL